MSHVLVSDEIYSAIQQARASGSHPDTIAMMERSARWARRVIDKVPGDLHAAWEAVGRYAQAFPGAGWNQLADADVVAHVDALSELCKSEHVCSTCAGLEVGGEGNLVVRVSLGACERE